MDLAGLDWFVNGDAWSARWLFVRALGVIYAVAFLAAALQFRPLLGSSGLLPVPRYLAVVGFRRRPSLFHWRYSDRLAVGLAWAGVAVSAAIALGVVSALPAWAWTAVWLTVFALYLSFVNVGQVWYAFGWESLLLEAGFFATFLGPDRIAVPRLAVWMLLWLELRVELGAGLIKLRGDRCWRRLTCLEYHHETQPLPSVFSWYAHHLPRWWHRVEVAGNHVTQLVVPFGLFAPQPVASASAVVIIATQGWLVATGNFAWLNALAIVLAIPALGGSWLAWLPVAPPASLPLPAPFAWLVTVTAVAVAVMSWWPIRNMASRAQRMNASFNPLHLVGTYGAFGSITRQRDEVVIEGTTDVWIDDDTTWRAYEFKAKPGALDRRPRQVAPYHLRLDWLMWFAAMSAPHSHPWFAELLRRLLTVDAATLRLLAASPFGTQAPRHVRATLYRYRFTTPDERRRTGHWWVRRRLGAYAPPVSLRPDGRLHRSG